LPSGYHRDLQVLKENFLPAFSDLQQCLRITCFMLKHIKVNKEIKNNDIYQHLFSVEAVNQLVMQGMPFRTAYQKVAKDIQQGGFTPPQQIQYTHEGSIGNLKNDKIKEAMEAVIQQFNFEKFEQALINLINLS